MCVFSVLNQVRSSLSEEQNKGEHGLGLCPKCSGTAPYSLLRVTLGTLRSAWNWIEVTAKHFNLCIVSVVPLLNFHMTGNEGRCSSCD